MGQRLNLEIHDGNYEGSPLGRLVANAYYHWSGYSESAVELLQDALKALKDIDEQDPLIRAIKVLEATGAGLTDEEREKNHERLGDYEPQATTGRNDGLIGLSAEFMKDTRSWEEGRIEIHLNPYKDEDYVVYEVFWKKDESEERREAERYNDEVPELKVIDFNFQHIPFDKIDELEEIVANHDAVQVISRVTFIK